MQKLATDSFGLFLHQVKVADDVLKAKVVQVVFDLLMVHNIRLGRDCVPCKKHKIAC